MTFLLMKNRFQQATGTAPKPEDANNNQPSSSSLGGNLMNALFGEKQQPARKTSHASDASSHSRASSERSQAYPPRRISFDEGDYGATLEKPVARSHQHQQQQQQRGDNNRPDDHSSGTTDPPDEEQDVDFGGDEEEHGKVVDRSESRGSDSSGPDSPQEAAPGMDDDLVMFMRQFVEQIFLNNRAIDQEEKNMFGEFARLESGRLWFARFVNSQRINYSSKVDEGTFYRLVQYCAIVLFECYGEDDFAPAKILMNICFTFYKEVPTGSSHRIRREFLYHHLRKQAIWHSLKFWNAAYFDAMQADRARRSHREKMDNSEMTHGYARQTSQPTGSSEEEYVYRTLADFLVNMRAFHVARESVIEFIRKQSNSINPDQFRLLREQIDAMYGSV